MESYSRFLLSFLICVWTTECTGSRIHFPNAEGSRAQSQRNGYFHHPWALTDIRAVYSMRASFDGQLVTTCDPSSYLQKNSETIFRAHAEGFSVRLSWSTWQSYSGRACRIVTVRQSPLSKSWLISQWSSSFVGSCDGICNQLIAHLQYLAAGFKSKWVF